jgi:hypothetical protein
MRASEQTRWGLGLLVLLRVSAASAAEIDWRAPAECPDAEELRFRVERAIGMPLSHAARLHFEARAVPSARGYDARVVIETETGTTRARELTAPDCAGLADMVTVTLALALGASDVALDGSDAGGLAAMAATRDVAKEAGPAAEPSVPAVVASASPAGDAAAQGDASPASGATSSWWPALSLWLLGDGGSLPRPGVGVAAGAQLESSHVQLRALGTWLFAQEDTLALAGEPAPGAELGLATGALLACVTPFGASASGLSAFGCGGWELGRLWGQGVGVQEAGYGAALWNAPRFDVGATWALGGSGLHLGVQLTLALPLSRDEFVLGELGSVHRPPAAVGRLAFGLGWASR